MLSVFFSTLKKTSFETCCHGGDDKEPFFVSLDKDDKQYCQMKRKKKKGFPMVEKIKKKKKGSYVFINPGNLCVFMCKCQ